MIDTLVAIRFKLIASRPIYTDRVQILFENASYSWQMPSDSAGRWSGALVRLPRIVSFPRRELPVSRRRPQNERGILRPCCARSAIAAARFCPTDIETIASFGGPFFPALSKPPMGELLHQRQAFMRSMNWFCARLAWPAWELQRALALRD